MESTSVSLGLMNTCAEIYTEIYAEIRGAVQLARPAQQQQRVDKHLIRSNFSIGVVEAAQEAQLGPRLLRRMIDLFEVLALAVNVNARVPAD